MVRVALKFAAVNLLLLGMALAGVGVAVGLWSLAQLAGASDALLQYLYFPIGIAAVFACGLTGKLAHRFLSRR